ncbi:MAG: hypothetical protein D6696_15400 [Acidobacteria bacterium]|nr:MAG: hypothetical protein D6696_15400 [Acidobacteriota bacterium]
MMRTLFLFLLLLLAQSAGAQSLPEALGQLFGGGGKPAETEAGDAPLSEQEIDALTAGLAAAESMLDERGAPPALDPILERRPEDFVGADPRRESFPYDEFLYLEGTPTLHCIPGRVCSLELESGEQIRATALGDVERWLYSELTAGSGNDERTVLAFLPRAFGIATNLLLTTDRRIYVLNLRSAPYPESEADLGELPLTERARFLYPQRWTQTKALVESPPARVTPSQLPAEDAAPRVDPSSLNFRYRVLKPWRKRLPWQPTAIYDDGRFTYVHLPAGLETLPAIRGIDAVTGEPFPLNETVHTEGGVAYVEIPRLVSKIELYLGTGRSRRSLSIVRQHAR